jgi:hypothetical protein
MFEEVVWVIKASRLCPFRVSILTVQVTEVACLVRPLWLREVSHST